MRLSFEVPRRLPGANEYTEACRKNARAGGRMKREATEAVAWAARAAGAHPMRCPVTVRITWVEPNMRRDKDNVRFAAKFVLDGLVTAGVMPGDGWKHVEMIEDRYLVNARNPRVVVEVIDGREDDDA